MRSSSVKPAFGLTFRTDQVNTPSPFTFVLTPNALEGASVIDVARRPGIPRTGKLTGRAVSNSANKIFLAAIKAIGDLQFEARGNLPLQDAKLIPKTDDLQMQSGSRPNPARKRIEEREGELGMTPGT
jgi:hypothetical protein